MLIGIQLPASTTKTEAQFYNLVGWEEKLASQTISETPEKGRISSLRIKQGIKDLRWFV